MTYEEMIKKASAAIENNDHDSALPILKELAEDGIRYGVYHLARCYAYGLGVEKNTERAQRLANRAVRMDGGGDALSQSEIQALADELNGVSGDEAAENNTIENDSAENETAANVSSGVDPDFIAMLNATAADGITFEFIETDEVEEVDEAQDTGSVDEDEFYLIIVDESIEKILSNTAEQEDYDRFYRLSLEHSERSSAAMYNLAHAYKNGWGTSQNDALATECFLKAAESGYVKAYVDIAERYLQICGIQEDTPYDECMKKALYWFRKAYNEDDGADREAIAEVIDLLDRYTGGDVNAAIPIARRYLTNNKKAQFYFFLSAAEHNNVSAYLPLAEMCYKGEGTQQDYLSAIKWATKFFNATQGCHPNDKKKLNDIIFNSFKNSPYPTSGMKTYTQAQEELAETYANAKQLYNTQKYAEAFPMMQKSAAGGIEEAMYYLSFMWRNGMGAPQKNPAISFTWMRKAAYEGYPLAYYELAARYSSGEGTAKNPDEARYWATKAINYRTPQAAAAQQLLTQLRYKPINVAAYAENAKQFYYNDDYANALRTAYPAALAGDGYSAYILASLLHHGLAIAKDEVEAFRWMKASAEAGCKDAFHSFFHPGIIHRYTAGIGTYPNLKKAQFWSDRQASLFHEQKTVCKFGVKALQDAGWHNVMFQVCCEQLSDERSFNFLYYDCLAECYEKGTGTEKDEDRAFFWADRGFRTGWENLAPRLARYYYRGIGVKKDLSKAEYYLDYHLARPGHPEAHALLREVHCAQSGDYTEMGLVRGADVQKVLKTYHEGERLYAANDYGRALPLLIEAGRSGHPGALYLIGVMYAEGKALAKNDQFALQFLYASAFRGYEPAQVYLQEQFTGGIVGCWKILTCMKGCRGDLSTIGLDRSGKKVIDAVNAERNYFRDHIQPAAQTFWDSISAAAEQGNPDAAVKIYEITDDPETKLLYMQLAAMMGHSQALFDMGVYCDERHSLTAANRCYIESAKRGFEKARSVCEVRGLKTW